MLIRWRIPMSPDMESIIHHNHILVAEEQTNELYDCPEMTNISSRAKERLSLHFKVKKKAKTLAAFNRLILNKCLKSRISKMRRATVLSVSTHRRGPRCAAIACTTLCPDIQWKIHIWIFRGAMHLAATQCRLFDGKNYKIDEYDK